MSALNNIHQLMELTRRGKVMLFAVAANPLQYHKKKTLDLGYAFSWRGSFGSSPASMVNCPSTRDEMKYCASIDTHEKLAFPH